MTWEETIVDIRKKPEFAELVKEAYFDEDLVLNVERFRSSLEYAETKKIISQYYPSLKALKVLDIGSGNGISAVSFALDGSHVTVVEPDRSDTIGSGAVRKLVQYYSLANVSVFDTYAEKLPLESDSFDLVYIRQAMHHAHDLNKFISEAARVLKKGGLLLTIRDHVIYDDRDKQWFLEAHPLHKYYGGENAFTFPEYKNAITSAGLVIKNVLRYFDSPINYFPLDKQGIEQMKMKREQMIIDSLEKKLPAFLSGSKLIIASYTKYVESKLGPALNEKMIPGRMYSFIAEKPL